MSNQPLCAPRRPRRPGRGPHPAHRLQPDHRRANRATARDRRTDELHTLHEELTLEVAQDAGAGPLGGRVAAALGAGARRMARDTNTELRTSGESR